jgi:hypothetical protein
MDAQMGRAERVVRLAMHFYEARDTARRLFGTTYGAEMAKYYGYIRRTMERHHCDALTALIRIRETAIDAGVILRGGVVLRLFAAAVDVLEAGEAPNG